MGCPCSAAGFGLVTHFRSHSPHSTSPPTQAKIVAMTCTHAALKRREFLDLAFKYDNLLMEEAGQILEIETFIPMLLQVLGPDSIVLLALIIKLLSEVGPGPSEVSCLPG